MKPLIAQTFNIPALKGMSSKSIEEHLKLYQGYVKNANAVLESMEKYGQDSANNAYILGELQRRFSFEYNGIRNHEVYFSSLEGGSTTLSEGSALRTTINETWGSFDNWLAKFKSAAASTRGIGWQTLSYDHKNKRLFTTWIDEQHLGQLQDCVMILGLDMWEHSYVADYQPSGKKDYIEDFFANLNWNKIEQNLEEAK